jgi:pyridoxamine 5'-phosphate oxidase
MRFSTAAQLARWLETEASGGDTAVGIAGKIGDPVLAIMVEQGFCPGGDLVHPNPGRYWISVERLKSRRKRQQQAILCADLTSIWWKGLGDPILQLLRWIEKAQAAGIPEPNAMTLATTGSDGWPSARIVLLKEVRPAGLVFYTNYGSRKGRDLAENPRAALVFFWPQLSRQVRITGPVVKTSRAESEAYFQTRPRGAQLAAWASWQSSPIADRGVLEARVRKMEAKFAGGKVALPPNWGGFRLRPESIEFWLGKPDRLHDRVRYSQGHQGGWKVERLAP